MPTPETPAPLSSPDITSMQKIVAALTTVITAALTALTAAGVGGLTTEQDTKILALWAALGGFAVVADAIIRQGRAKAHAAITIAAAQAAPVAAKRKPAARKKPAAVVAAAPPTPSRPVT